MPVTNKIRAMLKFVPDNTAVPKDLENIQVA